MCLWRPAPARCERFGWLVPPQPVDLVRIHVEAAFRPPFRTCHRCHACKIIALVRPSGRQTPRGPPPTQKRRFVVPPDDRMALMRTKPCGGPPRRTIPLQKIRGTVGNGLDVFVSRGGIFMWNVSCSPGSNLSVAYTTVRFASVCAVMRKHADPPQLMTVRDRVAGSVRDSPATSSQKSGRDVRTLDRNSKMRMLDATMVAMAAASPADMVG